MEANRSSSKDLALLIAFILIASIDSVYKYTGVSGLILYSLGAPILLFFYFTKAYPWLVAKVSQNVLITVAATVMVGLGVLAFFLYDLANSGQIGPGSDGDDALIIGATELLNGRYPFYPLTYLGNPIAPMPGAVIFAVPFVLLGIYPLQAVFWLCAFFAAIAITAGSLSRTLWFCLPLLAASPTIFQNISSGADHIANSVYLFIFSLFIIKAAGKDRAKWWEYAIPAVLLGVGLSSRSNFAFMVPLLFVFLWRSNSLRTAIGTCFIVGAAFIAVTLPFWLYDPPGFTPLSVQTGKMQQFNEILPHAGMIMAAIAALLTLGLSVRKRSTSTWAFYQNLAFVQLFILIFTSVLYSIWIGQFNMYFGHIGYGLFVMFFGVFAQWTKLSSTDEGT